MFAYCSTLAELDLSNFDTYGVTNSSTMFILCTNLRTIYVGNRWDLSNSKSSTNMFYSCRSLVGGNGTTFNSSNVDKTYGRIDTASTPGYLTNINDKPQE